MPEMITDDAAFSCEVEDGIATIRLKEETLKVATELEERQLYLNLFDRIEEDRNILGVVKIDDQKFSGEDQILNLLKKMITETNIQHTIAHRFRHSLFQIISRNMHCAKPVVTGVIGPMSIEELGIALMCDRLIISDTCLIKNVGINLGLPAGPILTFILPHMVGPNRAHRLLTEEEPLTAAEALSLGLVEKVVPEDKVEEECRMAVKKLARLPSPVVSVTRELIFSQYSQFYEHVERAIQMKVEIIRAMK